MMTIDEIKNVSFARCGRNGYSAIDVDNFIDEVIETFKQHDREKADIMKKIEILAKKIESYRSDEEIIKNALIRSERLSEDAVAEGKAKADKIISAAQAEADEMLAKTAKEAEIQKKNLELLKDETAKFRAQLLDMYKRQVQLVSELPNESAQTEAQEVSKEPVQPKEEIKPAQPVYEEPDEEEIDESEDIAEVRKSEEPIKRVPIVTDDISDMEDDEDEIMDLQKTRSFSLKSSPESADDGRRDRKKHKFSVLKFGDNYDLDEE